MKKYAHRLVTLLIFFSVLLAGCSSTDLRGKDAATVDPERRDNRTDTGKLENITFSEFVLGIGDTIEVTVYRHEELKRSAKIDVSGKIMFPLIGDIVVAGKGVYELRDYLEKRFSKYFVDPQVIVTVTGVQSHKIFVTGEVNSPGIFNLDSQLSALEAVFRAGGVTKSAKRSNVLLIRKESKGDMAVSSIDIDRILKYGDHSHNLMLKNGDIIYVPATAIADLNTFVTQFVPIISTIVNLESGIVLWPQVRDALKGKSTTPVSISPSSN